MQYLFRFCPKSSIPILTAQQEVERELKSGEQHLYQILLAEGAYLNLSVAYQGLITDVTFKAPNSQLLTERRSGGGGTLDSAEIAVIVVAAGTYQLFVPGRGAATNAGKYKLTVKALRAATELDRQMEVAQEMLAKARTTGLRQWELKGLKYVGLLNNSLNNNQGRSAVICLPSPQRH